MPTKILVVDDSATMCRVLQMTFAGEDAQVVTVDGGEAGVAKAAEFSPDVVFADASMKGVDGYELARRIKSNPALARTAVIVMASQHNPYDDGKGRNAGVDDHISKPFDTQGVIDRVAQVLARPRNVAASGGEAPRPVAAAPVPRPAAPPPAAPAPAASAPAAAGPATQQVMTTNRSVGLQATRMGIGNPLAGMAAQPSAPAPAAPVARPAAPAPAAPAMPARPVAAAAPFPLSAPAPAPAPVPARPAAAPAPAAKPAGAIAAATNDLAGKLNGLGLSREQVESVLSLSREIIEQVVWEVVPDLAEQLIKEEIKRLTAE